MVFGKKNLELSNQKMNPKPPTSKEFSSKHIKILEGLFKLPENKECADCRSRAPRWASINLGIFICLQCSGVHRSLGVHISKVRSATLDTWLPEQVAFMQSMGNEKSNAYWEKELPQHYNRGQIEKFIHAKYVEKRWIPIDSRVKSPPKILQKLGSSRSGRRFGSIAEWTNNQHSCKVRRDFSTGERDGISSSHGSGEVHKDHAVNKNLHQQPEKKENSKPSKDPDVKCVNDELSKVPAQVVPNSAPKSPNGSLLKSVREVSKIKSLTANAIPAVPSPKVDYADELFKRLCIDDSVDNDSSADTSSWVHFDSEQETFKPETEIVQKPDVQEVLISEARLTPKSRASKIHPGPEIEDVQTAMVPFKTGHFSEHQKDVTNDNKSLSEKPKLVSASSVHLQRLAMLAEGVFSRDAPSIPGSMHQGIDSFQQHQLNINRETVQRTAGTQMPMQNFQPVKMAVNAAPYTKSSLYTPAIPKNGMLTTPARDPPAALPVSGYNYDFSFLTQGMFTKR